MEGTAIKAEDGAAAAGLRGRGPLVPLLELPQGLLLVMRPGFQRPPRAPQVWPWTEALAADTGSGCPGAARACPSAIAGACTSCWCGGAAPLRG